MKRLALVCLGLTLAAPGTLGLGAGGSSATTVCVADELPYLPSDDPTGACAAVRGTCDADKLVCAAALSVCQAQTPDNPDCAVASLPDCAPRIASCSTWTADCTDGLALTEGLPETGSLVAACDGEAEPPTTGLSYDDDERAGAASTAFTTPVCEGPCGGKLSENGAILYEFCMTIGRCLLPPPRSPKAGITRAACLLMCEKMPPGWRERCKAKCINGIANAILEAICCDQGELPFSDCAYSIKPIDIPSLTQCLQCCQKFAGKGNLEEAACKATCRRYCQNHAPDVTACGT